MSEPLNPAFTVAKSLYFGLLLEINPRSNQSENNQPTSRLLAVSMVTPLARPEDGCCR